MSHNRSCVQYGIHNWRNISQVAGLPEDVRLALEVVAQVLPFRTNSYVVDELIDWAGVLAGSNDPIFTMTFPQKGMLRPDHFEAMDRLVRRGASREEMSREANRIRMELNPHPAGQMVHNVPSLDGERLNGVQHKYRETALFFPSQGQTCHAYCTFCFRWPQFVGIRGLKLSAPDAGLLIRYLREHPEATDVLFTGGDPMVMNAEVLSRHINALLGADLPNLQTIRIGTKSLSWWPYRFLTDPDADSILRLFERVVKSGKHLSVMAHFSHPRELGTNAVLAAVVRIRSTGAVIRTQAPIIRHVNDHADTWSQLWRKQVKLGLIPYYMFVARDTGAHHFFSVTLAEALEIYRHASQKMSGLCGTVRGPIMSTHPGKVQILGVSEIEGKKVFVLTLVQSRNPAWSRRPFFAKYNPDATWLDELEPAFGEDRFFFEDELREMYTDTTTQEV